MNHPELLFNYKNAEELEINQKDLMDFLIHNPNYTYCKLCNRSYKNNTSLKKHTTNQKHMKYEHQRTTSSVLSK